MTSEALVFPPTEESADRLSVVPDIAVSCPPELIVLARVANDIRDLQIGRKIVDLTTKDLSRIPRTVQEEAQQLIGPLPRIY